MTTNNKPRMILAVATETDDATKFIWDRLENMQADLFAAGPIRIKFAYFGQENTQRVRPYSATEWITNEYDMRSIMDRARKRCICGCFIYVDDILEHALHEAQQAPVQAAVIVGDYFRGDINAALALAKKLRAAGTRLFLYRPIGGGHRGQAEIGTEKFRILAETTGGAFIEFNPYIEVIAEQLPTTLEALTHFTVGGIEALKEQATQHDNDAAMLLLEQMTAVPFTLEFEDQLVPEEVKRGR
jgi:hypothetical protein